MPAKKPLTKQEALARMQRYCAYQDRCHHEARYKLVALGQRGDDIEDILTDLIQAGFLDEERFARAYVRGKFRNNVWGWNKIVQGLRAKRISEYLINKAKQEIDEDAYREQLRTLLTAKMARLPDTKDRYQKLFRYAYGKGYESELVAGIIAKIID